MCNMIVVFVHTKVFTFLASSVKLNLLPLQKLLNGEKAIPLATALCLLSALSHVALAVEVFLEYCQGSEQQWS